MGPSVNATSRSATGKGPKGRFITLEGGEGTGKSTQIERLATRLAAKGIDTLSTREPGGSPKAEKLREIILSGGVAPLGPVAETLAFAAARIDHIDETIKPALAEGCFVLCDRFMDSTRAYQGVLGDVDEKLIDQIELVTVGDTRPDLTIILDVPAETGMARANLRRANAKPDRFEAEDIAFHTKVRDAFLAIAKKDSARCAVIDASQAVDVVEREIWALVEKRILKREGRKPSKSRGATSHLRVVENQPENSHPSPPTGKKDTA